MQIIHLFWQKEIQFGIINYQVLISEALESDDENEEEEAPSAVDATYEHPEQVVTVTTISDVNLDGGKFTCIGPNKVNDRY